MFAICSILPVLVSADVSAASAPAPETRAAFTCALASALHLAPLPISQTPFTDLDATSPQCAQEIAAAYHSGWLSGTGPHSFSPGSALTREQVAKLEINALGLTQAANALVAYRPFFTDSDSIGAWAWGYVDEAHKTGILNGFADGTFGPAVTFTPAQASHALAQLLSYRQGTRPATTYLQPPHVPDVTKANAVYAIGVTFDPNAPALSYVPFSDVTSRDTRTPWLWDAVQKGWIQGATTTGFGPDLTISRAQLLSVAVAALGDAPAAAALQAQPSPYRDDAAIPSQFRGAVDEAAKLGLLPVGPDALLGPNAPATSFDLDAIVQRMLAVQGQEPWATAPSTVSRAAFVYDLTLAAGELPYVLHVNRTVSSLPDVPDSTPGVYYIEQAEEQGWVQGIVAYPSAYESQGTTSLPLGASLLPNQPITLGSALELSDIATESAMYPSSTGAGLGAEYARMLAQGLARQPLPFSDSAAMPQDARGYVAEALMFGILPSSTGPLRIDEPITPQESASLLSRLRAMILSRIEHPHTPGQPAYIGTSTIEPVPVQCSTCSPFSAIAFDRQGYKTSAAITASAGAGVTVKAVANTPVTNGNVVTVNSDPATPVEVSAKTSGMTTVTVRSGAAASQIPVPVVTPPLSLIMRPASQGVTPGADTVVTVEGKDATGKVFPVNVYWRITPPSFTEGYPQFQWGLLSDWGPSASTTFEAGSSPGQGQIDAVIPSVTSLSPFTQGSATMNVLSDARTLHASIVDQTTGSTSIASVGDTLSIHVEALDANGRPAATPDVVGMSESGPQALHDGAASWTMRADSPGSIDVYVSDLSQAAVQSVHLQISVVVELQPGPETGVALFDQLGRPGVPPPAGGQEQVWVRPVDAKGMPTTVSATSPQTVDLLTSGTTFSASQGGDPIATVTLAPGSKGVELWLQAAPGSTQQVAVAALAPIKISSPIDGQTVAIDGNFGTIYTVVDANGNPIQGIPVTFSLTAPTGSDTDQNQDPPFHLAPTVVLTGSSGQASAVITGGSTAPDSDFSAQLSASVEGFATSTPATLTW